MTYRATVISALAIAQAVALAGAAQAEGAKFSFALGAAYMPTYQGSDTNETIGFIDFNASFADGAFFAGTRGIGWAPINTEEMTVSLALGYGGGRKVSDDTVNLAGMGDLDDEALALISGEYRMGQFSFGADLTAGKDYGVTADFKVGTGVECTDRITLGGEISATYADDSHMQRYFGVTAAQVAPGRGVYSAGSGIKSASIGMSVNYAMTDSTSINFGARYDKLMGDAADSTLTRDKSQTSAFLGLSTQF